MKTFKVLTKPAVLAAAVSLAATTGALAHEEKGHEGRDHSATKYDHTPVAGGIVAVIGHYDGELVGADGKMTLLLKDHDGKEAATDGYKASVLVLSGGERKGPFELMPAGGNKLEGKGVPLAAGQRAIVTLTDAGGKASQGRFEAK